MKLQKLTYLLFIVNSALDSGKDIDIKFEEVRNHAEKQNFVGYLKVKLDRDLNLTAEETAELNEKIERLSNAVYDRERRKFGVENNGLCLIIAYLTEIIQNYLD